MFYKHPKCQGLTHSPLILNLIAVYIICNVCFQSCSVKRKFVLVFYTYSLSLLFWGAGN